MYSGATGLTALSYAKARARFTALGNALTILTQTMIDNVLATRGADWTQKELDYLSYQLNVEKGQSFTDDGFGNWTFADGAEISTQVAGFNNFSLSTGNAAQDVQNAFDDTYGNQLDVDYTQWQQQANRTWWDPHSGNLVPDAVYKTLVGIQNVLKQGPTVDTQTQIQALIDRATTAAEPLPVIATGPGRFLVNGVEVYADGSPVDAGYDAAVDAAQQVAAQGGGVNPVDGQYVPAAPGSSPAPGVVALDPTVVTNPAMPNGSPVAIVPAPGVVTDPMLPPVSVNPSGPSGPSVISAGGFVGSALGQPVVLGALAIGAYLLLRKRSR